MAAKALRRTHYRRSTSSGRGVRLALVAAALGLLVLTLLAVLGVVLRLSAALPDVGLIETQFGLRGAEAFQPMLVFDRSGQKLIYQYLNPAAQRREWVEPSDLPDYAAEALLAVQEPDYWEGSGYQLLAPTDPQQQTIAERLVVAALLPPSADRLSRRLSTSLLAAELSNRYPKERILNWYINTADFGAGAYGIDAAALTYFGKHAEQLGLEQAALLAGLADDPQLDPWQQPLAAAAARERVLQAMPDLTASEIQQAANRPLGLEGDDAGWDRPGWVSLLLSQLEQTIGRPAMGRSGLRVITTLDAGLQDQSGCAAQSHVERLSGASIDAAVDTPGGQPCQAAALLPTLRPGDVGLQHGVEDWGLVILDPQSGEILAAQGTVDAPQTTGSIIDPFTYVTAFARGSAPASMVVDIGQDLDQSHGPVRMRTALANLYPYATAELADSLGSEAIGRTLSQFGLSDGSAGGQAASLLELGSAYGVLAAEGVRAGLGGADQSIHPSLLLEVRQADGAPLYQYTPTERAILSPQLAYLVDDVLSDESARWPSLGQGNLLELGFPTGAVSAASPDSQSSWAVGFTPQRVVGVWMGGSPLRQVDRLNGAASVWHAVMRFASAGLNAGGWQRPAGVSEIDVCDPSGLLPTSYCPSVVREVFAAGTEPTSFDDLYQPVRINRETGKLATLFTPLESVEQRVYFVPPPEASQWAAAVGIELPPEEYDPLSGGGPSWPGVDIRSPDPFEILGDRVAILGEAAPEDFQYYRLQYGQGLDPAHWVQIGSDQQRQVPDGLLGSWATQGLNGLYTLQLLVILNDGEVHTAAVPVTVDNQPPQVQLVAPQDEAQFSMRAQPLITLQAEVQEDVAIQRVEFLVDGRRVSLLSEGPFTYSWEPDQPGEYELVVRAYDQAGNRSDSLPVTVSIER